MWNNGANSLLVNPAEPSPSTSQHTPNIPNGNKSKVRHNASTTQSTITLTNNVDKKNTTNMSPNSSNDSGISDNTLTSRPAPVKSPYEWMKKTSYQTQPNPGITTHGIHLLSFFNLVKIVCCWTSRLVFKHSTQRDGIIISETVETFTFDFASIIFEYSIPANYLFKSRKMKYFNLRVTNVREATVANQLVGDT